MEQQAPAPSPRRIWPRRRSISRSAGRRLRGRYPKERRCRPARCASRGPGPLAGCRDTAKAAGGCRTLAAALPARMLGPVAGEQVLDLCAAPGGKTAQLAAAGARVTAVDRAPARLDTARANLARLGLEAEWIEADAAEWRPERPVPGRVAGRALQRHRHDPPASRHPAPPRGTAARPADRAPGPPARRRGPRHGARRAAGLCLLLAGARGRAGTRRRLPRRAARFRAGAGRLSGAAGSR